MDQNQSNHAVNSKMVCIHCVNAEWYLSCIIIPKGQDAELMGMYLFAGQALVWLPPLVFTAMNKAGVSIRIGMLSLLLFWNIAIVLLQCMGSYDEAVREANKVVLDSQINLT